MANEQMDLFNTTLNTNTSVNSEDIPKRRRGRPRKNADNNISLDVEKTEINANKAPAKEDVFNQDNPPVKKKRGRPKKQVSETPNAPVEDVFNENIEEASDNSLVTTVDTNPLKKKRKRGRPRKNISEEVKIDDTSSFDTYDDMVIIDDDIEDEDDISSASENIPSKPVITNNGNTTCFDYTSIYKKELDNKIKEIEKICNNNKIPFFISLCTFNDENITKYENTLVSPYKHELKITDDYFPKYVNVVNGFSTVPPADVLEINFD